MARARSGDGEGDGTTRLLLGMALASGITSVPNAAIVLALNEAPTPWAVGSWLPGSC
jgi:hypothetical protein